MIFIGMDKLLTQCMLRNTCNDRFTIANELIGGKLFAEKSSLFFDRHELLKHCSNTESRFSATLLEKTNMLESQWAYHIKRLLFLCLCLLLFTGCDTFQDSQSHSQNSHKHKVATKTTIVDSNTNLMCRVPIICCNI